MEKKKFKDLKIGDTIFIVNQGVDFGVRIEPHKIISILNASKENFDDFSNANETEIYDIKFDDGFPLLIYGSSLNQTKYSFCFSNFEDAGNYFLEIEREVYTELVGKCAKYLRKYNECIEIMNNMSFQKHEVEKKLNSK